MENEVRKGRNGGRLKVVKPGDLGHANAGRPKGTPNRKTLFAKFLLLETEYPNPITKAREVMTVAEAIALAQIAKAGKGDPSAYDRVMDAMFGKIPDRVEVAPSDGFPMEEMSDEDLEQLANQQSKP
jgi:hypothetical protein